MMNFFVLRVSNSRALSKYTPLFAGMLVRDVHCVRVSSLGYEHESGADPELRASVRMDRSVDLLYGPLLRMPLATLVYRSSQRTRLLRQATPSQSQALHFSLPFREKCRMTTTDITT